MTHSFPTRRSSDLSLPPAPRSKLVRSVRSRPSVLTSPWLKKQLWTSTTALPRFGSRVSEHGAPGIGVGSSPLSMLISCCERSEEHTSELQSLMRISYAVFCLKKKKHERPSI